MILRDLEAVFSYREVTQLNVCRIWSTSLKMLSHKYNQVTILMDLRRSNPLYTTQISPMRRKLNIKPFMIELKFTSLPCNNNTSHKNNNDVYRLQLYIYIFIIPFNTKYQSNPKECSSQIAAY